MKTFYEQLKKIQEKHYFNHSDFTVYIHRQKTEVSAHLSISPEFWVVMDYIIHLTSAILKKPKIEAEKDIATIIKPVFERYNRKIEKVLRKIPEKEYFFLKKDMKTFHHIICHSINLIDKGLPHFIPSYLFIDSIENMNVLFPLHEKTCDPGTLARNNYPVLLSRYISSAFSQDLEEIINFIIWIKHVLPHAIPEDKVYLKNKMIMMIEDFVKEKHEFKKDPEYSTRKLIVELREIITLSYIREQMNDLLKKIKTPGANVSLSDCLIHIASIFIDTENFSPHKYTVRDLTIITNLIEEILLALKEKDQKKLFDALYTIKTMRSFLSEVSRYMLNPEADTEMLKFIEISTFLDESYPSMTFSYEITEILGNIRKILESEKELICSSHNVSIDDDALDLFKAKMKQIYSAKITD